MNNLSLNIALETTTREDAYCYDEQKQSKGGFCTSKEEKIRDTATTILQKTAELQQSPPSSPHDLIACKNRNNFTCTSRQKDSPGFRYTFKLRPEPIGTSKFPALEPDNQWLEELPTHQFKKHPTLKTILQKLGYEFDFESKQITLPDPASLQERWNRVRKEEEYAYLPKINFKVSPGIATDQNFIEQFCLENGITILISTEEEFTHDHCFHFIPTIQKILEMEGREKGSFAAQWKTHQKAVLEAYSMVKKKFREKTYSEAQLFMAMHLLGAVIDSFTAQPCNLGDSYLNVIQGLEECQEKDHYICLSSWIFPGTWTGEFTAKFAQINK